MAICVSAYHQLGPVPLQENDRVDRLAEALDVCGGLDALTIFGVEGELREGARLALERDLLFEENVARALRNGNQAGLEQLPENAFIIGHEVVDVVREQLLGFFFSLRVDLRLGNQLVEAVVRLLIFRDLVVYRPVRVH